MDLLRKTYSPDPIDFYEADIKLTKNDRMELHHEINKILTNAGVVSLGVGIVGFTLPKFYTQYISHKPMGVFQPLVSMIIGSAALLGSHNYVCKSEYERRIDNLKMLQNKRITEVWKHMDPDRFEFYAHYYLTSAQNPKLILRDPRLADRKYSQFPPISPKQAEDKIEQEVQVPELTLPQWQDTTVSHAKRQIADPYFEISGMSLGVDNPKLIDKSQFKKESSSSNFLKAESDSFLTPEEESTNQMSVWERIRNSSR
ncbi:uncharacterized protein J8A68_001495 [[Candida] subhashii]|uniref:Transmembrane protein n=1 Tax=[Candida] subhashii TaxID=561895 RepID=A0A8J5URW5_9ASCO|nr:uncharacterized protein J8A68_001495 [[Candida] subhashii]KAG7664967.1 hypothetical protein J8A68_001495 [[Candida] subhashii]